MGDPYLEEEWLNNSRKDPYWMGRIQAYRTVRERLLADNWDFPG